MVAVKEPVRIELPELLLQPISARLEYDAAESDCTKVLTPCAPAFDIVKALDEETHPGFWSETVPVSPKLFVTVALVAVDLDVQFRLPKILSWLSQARQKHLLTTQKTALPMLQGKNRQKEC